MRLIQAFLGSFQSLDRRLDLVRAALAWMDDEGLGVLIRLPGGGRYILDLGQVIEAILVRFLSLPAIMPSSAAHARL